MLTIFTVPKPSHGPIAVIQRNAVQSWLCLRPACEVILFGEDAGVADLAANFGVRHLPEIDKNQYGTPLLSSVFELAQMFSKEPLMCYVNSDIILLSDLLSCLRFIVRRAFLVAGQRFDIEVDKPINFSDVQWEAKLRLSVMQNGVLHDPTGIDYFIFPRGIFKEIPPFAVGRPAWDNWMIYKARSLGIPVIDGTQAVTAIHQNHDYSHHPGGKGGAFEGLEARENLNLAGGYSRTFYLMDANWLLTPQGLKPALTDAHLRRALETLPVLFQQNSLQARILKRRISLRLSFRDAYKRWKPRLHPRRLTAALLRRIYSIYSFLRRG